MSAAHRDTGRRTTRTDKRDAHQSPYTKPAKQQNRQPSQPTGFWGYVKSLAFFGGDRNDEEGEDELPVHHPAATSLSTRGREMQRQPKAQLSVPGLNGHQHALPASKPAPPPQQQHSYVPYQPPIPPSSAARHQIAIPALSKAAGATAQQRVANFLLNRGEAPLNEFELEGIHKALTEARTPVGALPSAAQFQPTLRPSTSPSRSFLAPSAPAAPSTSYSFRVGAPPAPIPSSRPKKYLSVNPNPVRYNGLGSTARRPIYPALPARQGAGIFSVSRSTGSMHQFPAPAEQPSVKEGKRRKVDEPTLVPQVNGYSISDSRSAPSLSTIGGPSNPPSLFQESNKTINGSASTALQSKGAPATANGVGASSALPKVWSKYTQPLAHPSPLRQIITPPSPSPPTTPAKSDDGSSSSANGSSKKSRAFTQMKDIIDDEAAKAVEKAKNAQPVVLNPYQNAGPVKTIQTKRKPIIRRRTVSKSASPAPDPVKMKSPTNFSDLIEMSEPNKPDSSSKKPESGGTEPAGVRRSSRLKSPEPTYTASSKRNPTKRSAVVMEEIEDDDDIVEIAPPQAKKRKPSFEENLVVVEEEEEEEDLRNVHSTTKIVRPTSVVEPDADMSMGDSSSSSIPSTSSHPIPPSLITTGSFSQKAAASYARLHSPTFPSPLRMVSTMDDGPKPAKEEVRKFTAPKPLSGFGSFAGFGTGSSSSSTTSSYFDKPAATSTTNTTTIDPPAPSPSSSAFTFAKPTTPSLPSFSFDKPAPAPVPAAPLTKVTTTSTTPPKSQAASMDVDQLPVFTFKATAAFPSLAHAEFRQQVTALPQSSLPAFDLKPAVASTSNTGGFSFSSTSSASSAASKPLGGFNWGAANPSLKPAAATSGTWNCSTCMLKNDDTDAVKCAICDAPRVQPAFSAPASSRSSLPSEPLPKVGFNWGAANPSLKPSAATSGTWNCSTCLLKNDDADAVKCAVCDSPRAPPASSAPNPSPPPVDAPPKPPVVGFNWAAANPSFNPSTTTAGSWACGTCMCKNFNADATKCKICDAPR